MKTRYIVLLALAFVLIIAAITNPSKEAHKERVKKEIASVFGNQQNSVVNIFSQMLAGVATDFSFDNFVVADNYLFFSLTKIKTPVYNKTVGIGIFGRVYLFGTMDDAMAELRKQTGL